MQASEPVGVPSFSYGSLLTERWDSEVFQHEDSNNYLPHKTRFCFGGGLLVGGGGYLNLRHLTVNFLFGFGLGWVWAGEGRSVVRLYD